MVSVPEAGSQDGSPPRRALVVAGMHRSGTSAMARALSLLGAALPRTLMEAHPDNPVGFWESEKVADFNDEILGTLDSEWDDVFSFRPRPYLSNFDRVFAGRAVELVDAEFDGAELIAFKDPRVSVLTAFWERALRQAGYSTTYVIMVRNPLEVSDSLRTRNNFPRDKSLLLWSSYMIAVERDTRGLPRLFIAYDDLMQDWRKVILRVQDIARVPFPRDTPAAHNQIDAFLDRSLRHHSTSAEHLSARGDVPDYVATLYDLFQSACAGADIDPQVIEVVEAELSKIEMSVGSLVADLRARSRSLEKELAEVQAAEQGATERAAALAEEVDTSRQQVSDLTASLEREQEEVRQQEAALSDAHAKLANYARTEADLNNRIAMVFEELSKRDDALKQANARLAEQARLDAGLRDAAVAEEKRLREAAVAEERRLREEAVAEEVRKREAAIVQMQARLSEQLREKDAAIHQSQEALERSRAEKQAADDRLDGRFQELASLTRMLADAEERERHARAEAEWLREAGSVLLNGATRRKGGRLLALLPASLQARQQRRMLKEMGLFDEEAYLASNPDVAAEGADPLGHYVKHGISEDRRRG